MRKLKTKFVTFFLLGVSLLLLSACSSAFSQPVVREAVAPQVSSQDGEVSPDPVLIDLGGVEELQALLNQDTSMPRLLLLLSPT